MQIRKVQPPPLPIEGAYRYACGKLYQYRNGEWKLVEGEHD